jgi:hypothetical protein
MYYINLHIGFYYWVILPHRFYPFSIQGKASLSFHTVRHFSFELNSFYTEMVQNEKMHLNEEI